MSEASLKPVIAELETLEVHVLCGECEVAFEEQE